MSVGNILSKLFPRPSLSPSAISPHIFPGVTPESTKTVRNVLEDNYKKHHIFFNDKRFHNHIIHRALAVWALGGDAHVIQAGYDHDKSSQRPSYESPEPITRDNFKDHLGDENFYDGYLKYFVAELDQSSVGKVIEESVFSPAFNFAVENKFGEHPEMLSRFLDGLLHPMIHTGYGVEFDLPGTVAEGLAQTAVHKASSTAIVPPTAFSADSMPSDGSLSSRLYQMTFGSKNATAGKTSPHAFTTLARVLKDDKVKPGDPDAKSMYVAALEESGEAIHKHVSEWAEFDPSDPEIVKRKVEELQWVNVLFYAIPGFEAAENKEFKADFFTMHLVTSSLFLPSLIAPLSPASQHLLLRSYFASSLGWYIGRIGKKPLDIGRFFAADTATPALMPTPEKSAPNSLSAEASNPNPWLGIINQSINHLDDHLCKIQRALGHYSTLYGWRATEDSEFSATELEGAEKIDGTLFIRAAGLTAKRLAREQEGDGNPWD
ncbi:hypothetical protein AAF712_010598 [Marasmius tenuissimus]|uniref:HypA-like protein n=1 Tax=Marasmius tenuissimus TaxID=585030 RepID=A0ABR2ZNQ1_9AGAR